MPTASDIIKAPVGLGGTGATPVSPPASGAGITHQERHTQLERIKRKLALTGSVTRNERAFGRLSPCR